MTRQSWVPILLEGCANQENLEHTPGPVRASTSHTDPRQEAEFLGHKDAQVEGEVGEFSQDHGIVVDDLVNHQHFRDQHRILWGNSRDMVSHADTSIVVLHCKHSICVK